MVVFFLNKEDKIRNNRKKGFKMITFTLKFS